MALLLINRAAGSAGLPSSMARLEPMVRQTRRRSTRWSTAHQSVPGSAFTRADRPAGRTTSAAEIGPPFLICALGGGSIRDVGGAAAGTRCSRPDMIIAAVAGANDCIVVTDNEKDFPGPGSSARCVDRCDTAADGRTFGRATWLTLRSSGQTPPGALSWDVRSPPEAFGAANFGARNRDDLMSDLYEDDILLWSERQAELLRRRAAGERVNDADIDWPNVAEEIEDVGKSERREIESRLAVLCTHLLKWRFQPKRRSRSWAGSITEARNQIERVIRGSPSLKGRLAKMLAEAYADGRRVAAAETGLKSVPPECPWSVEEILRHDFWPTT